MSCAAASTQNPAAPMTQASTSGVRNPTLAPSRPASGLANNMVTAIGMMNSPASVTDAPNP